MHSMRPSLQWSGLMVGYIVLSSNSPVNSRSFFKMADLAPPPAVRGMKKLDRKLFDKTIDVPCLRVKGNLVRPLTEVLKRYRLKLVKFQPIRSVANTETVVNDSNQVINNNREMILNPKVVTCFNDISPDDQKKLCQLGVDESCFRTCSLKMTYDNWTTDEVLTAVLPEGVEAATSYSLVGHIVHINLREHLLDFKHVIGEVLLDKIKQARTVVNKVDSIDNMFRVFNMEVIAGEHEFVTEVKENSVTFKFDFSGVYWNPRLSTEHERIVKKLNPGNVLYDIFAGVGPFSIPAAKKKCIVLANDLNPESYKWLQHNAKLNKVEEFMTIYNKDGADFIREQVKDHILHDRGESKAHIVMNLPSLAVTFLQTFKHLFSANQLDLVKALPLVHVYCFVKGVGNMKEMAKELVENQLNCSISEHIDEVSFVRNVAPNKEMMRVSFQLTESMVLGAKRKSELCSDENKLQKIM